MQMIKKILSNYKARGLKLPVPHTPRRAQIKMFETVAVLAIFFFLLFTGSIFYFGAQKSSLQKEKIKNSEQYAFQITLKSLYMPELDCSFLSTQKDNCIDKIKLQKLKEMLEEDIINQEYFNEFGYATITIQEAFPSSTTIKLYENIPTETRTIEGEEKEIQVFTGKLTTQSPILLYDPWTEEYAFGIIEVAVYV